MTKLSLFSTAVCLLVVSTSSRAGEPVSPLVRPLVVAHRGILRHAPENTLANFRACLELRLGFEFDVAKTKDGRLVCIHDATVDRTTNGTGKVADLSLEQIQRLDAGDWFDRKFAGQRVPTVDDVMKLIAEYRHLEVLIAVDLKDADVEQEVVRLAEKHDVLHRLLFIGRAISEPVVREQIKRASNKAQTAALANDAGEFAKALAATHADWVYLRFIPTKGQMESVHRAGKRAFLAGKTVSGNEPDNWRRAASAGIDGILTDYPLELADVLRPTEESATAAIKKLGGKVVVDDTAPGKPVVMVDLDSTAAGDADLDVLAAFKMLGKLYLNGTKVSDAGIKAVARCRNLETLDLRNTRVTGTTMGELAPLERLRTLYLTNTAVTDAGLRAIASVEQLEILNLRGARVTDEGMPSVAGMKNLKTLNLTSTQVTDAGLRRLTPLSQLESLYLNYTAATDRGLGSVAQLKKLQTLNLRGTSVTDAGLKTLTGLADLRTLFLPGTRVTDAGLDELKAFTKLQSLSLDAAAVTDAGIRKLAVLRKLESLYLSGTKLTDAGLRELASMKELRWLDVRETGATEAGAAALRGSLPECKIVR